LLLVIRLILSKKSSFSSFIRIGIACQKLMLALVYSIGILVNILRVNINIIK
jgi:hypothetical protein